MTSFTVHFSDEAGRELLVGRARSKGRTTCAPDRRANGSVGGMVPGLQDRSISICWPSAEKRKFVFAVRTQGAHKTVPAEDS